MYCVAYGDGKFVAVSESGGIAYSSEGENWTAGDSTFYGSYGFIGVAYGDGKFVVVGYEYSDYNNITGILAYSTDGETWVLVTGITTSEYFSSVAYGDGKWVAAGSEIIYSPDGTDWITVNNSTLRATDQINSVAYGGDIFVAVGQYGKIIYTSR
jgi:hypothetical protein